MHTVRLGLTAWWQGWGWVARLTWGMHVSNTCSPFTANPLGAGGSWRGKGEDTDIQTVQLLLNKTSSSVLSGSALFAEGR